MNRFTSLILSLLMLSVAALNLKRHLHKPLTTVEVATLDPLVLPQREQARRALGKTRFFLRTRRVERLSLNAPGQRRY